MKELDTWRDRIDEIDTELVRLLNERAACAAKIGEIKKKAGLPIEYPEREAAIRRRICELNDGPLADGDLVSIVQMIIERCKKIEE